MDDLILYMCIGIILIVFKYSKSLVNIIKRVNDSSNITEEDIKNLESYVKSR